MEKPSGSRAKFELESREKSAIEDLERPIAHIFKQLRPEIEKGSYGAIIGEDASGRIPALIFSEAISGIYNAKNIEAPLLRFVSGASSLAGGPDRDEKLRLVTEQAARIQKEMQRGDRMLLVTEAISLGVSIRTLIPAFQKNGIHLDVASVGVDLPSTVPQLEEYHGTRIVYGQYGTPDIHGRHELHGVKSMPTELFSSALARTSSHLGKESGQEVQDKISASREIAHSVAQSIALEFLKDDISEISEGGVYSG